MMVSVPTLRLSLLAAPVLLVGTGVWMHPPPDATPADGVVYAEHPPLAHTGGFGEPTCRVCHVGRDGTGGDGSLGVDGLPDMARPGHAYRLSVQLDAPMKRAGFMLAVRHLDRTQAGRLSPLDTARAAVHTVDSTGVQYVHHTPEGTALPESDRATWHVRWTAPDAPVDTVLIHVVANAANDDASEFGDEIYTRTRRVGFQ